MAYHHFRTNLSEAKDNPLYLYDQDGAIIYENDYGALRDRIIQLNDVATLKQYIAKCPRGVLNPGETHYHDPFYIAAERGSTDVLRVLLDLYNADSTQTKPFNERGLNLLHIACANAQLETVRFLLEIQPSLGDSKLQLGTIQERNEYGDTALLCAASSLADYYDGDWQDNNYSDDWIRDRFARSEKLMQLLLDRGACARDSNTVGFFRGHYDEQTQQPRDTVLSLAISRGSYGLIKRLIDEGANVYRKEWHQRIDNISFRGSGIDAQNVTVLHIGSSYWNVEGIKALFDHGGHDLILCADSIGRLPIHWAAAGPGLRNEDTVPENEIDLRIINTFKLLLLGYPNAINVQDKLGATPLHYAVGTHAWRGIRHSYLAIKFLCEENKADSGLINGKGQTVLHLLAYHSMGGEPIDIALMDLLLAHGADISHADANGDTALHIMAKNLGQVEAARFLVSKGADVSILNSKGNTPIHEVTYGLLRHPSTRKNEYKEPTLAEKLRAQNGMIGVLQDGKGYSSSLMDQPNAAGKTPRQILEETRAKWREYETGRVERLKAKQS